MSEYTKYHQATCVRRATAVLGSGVFFVIAPGVVAGLIPWWITRWQFMPPFLNMELTRVMGFLLMLAGVPGLVDSFRRFAVQGLGTPAPVAPPQHLVTTGLYRYVRNPMYFSVVAVILGQAGVFDDWRTSKFMQRRCGPTITACAPRAPPPSSMQQSRQAFLVWSRSPSV